MPDFKRSGLMPLAHRFYSEIFQVVDRYGLDVSFCDWMRSPFGVAVHIRGMTESLLDTAERPEFLKQLLDFLATVMIEYRTQRAKCVGSDLDKPVFHNDEVNVPSMSPRAYKEVILPSEIRYAKAFDGLAYWHSCGNVTPMIPTVREIANITIFHVGPWTDLAAAIETFGDCTLDICLDSLNIYQASEEQMREKITSIVETCHQNGAKSFSIRPGILQAFQSIEEDLESAARWVRVAKETLQQTV